MLITLFTLNKYTLAILIYAPYNQNINSNRKNTIAYDIMSHKYDFMCRNKIYN